MATVARLEVQPGDTVDFVVESLATLTNDQHAWAPVVRHLNKPGATPVEGANTRTEWIASADFSGTRLNAWEAYAQALLMSNELVFVD